MEAIYSSETSENFYLTDWRNIPYVNVHKQRRQNLESHERIVTSHRHVAIQKIKTVEKGSNTRAKNQAINVY
jgi:hypothetical protein